MRKKRQGSKSIITTVILIALAMVMFVTVPVKASEASCSLIEEDKDYLLYKNDNSGYEMMIDDAADLLTAEEEEQLIPYMAKCSDAGFVLLVTTENNSFGDPDKYADDYFWSRIPNESGVLFLIDMDTRKLLFYGSGRYEKTLGKNTLNIICDNVYKYASNGDYYGCAKEAFSEVSDILDGKRIAAPMKYISNACLAILLALIFNYFIARTVSKAAKPSASDVIRSIYSRFEFSNPNVVFLNETRTYSPRSSGSGGGGGGGGGHSHSSGSHSF